MTHLILKKAKHEEQGIAINIGAGDINRISIYKFSAKGRWSSVGKINKSGKLWTSNEIAVKTIGANEKKVLKYLNTKLNSKATNIF